jgi:hypothetical protein
MEGHLNVIMECSLHDDSGLRTAMPGDIQVQFHRMKLNSHRVRQPMIVAVASRACSLGTQGQCVNQ